MADVFSQIYLHIIFTPKRREALIQPEWEERLHKYMTGFIQNRGHKLLAIGGMPDHVHLFIGFKPSDNISDLVKGIKTQTNGFINAENLTTAKFEWQNGYGVFSHSRSQIKAVCQYIRNQKEHHQKKTFSAEFFKMCEDFGVEVGKKDFFDWVGENNLEVNPEK